MNLIEKLRSAAKGGHYPRNLATEAADEIERLSGGNGVAASLAAAISILERAAKEKKPPQKVVASDKMFGVMLSDYKKSLAVFRAAII